MVLPARTRRKLSLLMMCALVFSPSPLRCARERVSTVPAQRYPGQQLQ